jgi:hypothetical protein
MIGGGGVPEASREEDGHVVNLPATGRGAGPQHSRLLAGDPVLVAVEPRLYGIASLYRPVRPALALVRIIRALALFLIVFVVLAVLCVLIGSLVVVIRGSTTYADGIAWALWIGGALTVLLASLSGSSGRMAVESRVVVGGRFVSGSDIPQPQSPFVLIPAGLLVIGLGALIFIVSA